MDVDASNDLNGCAIVVAHPDDEVLWASSVLRRAGKVVICFGPSSTPGMADRRRQAMDGFPLKSLEFLDRPESDVYNRANWPHPVPGPDGLVISTRLGMRPAPRKDYRRSFETLSADLLSRLQGVSDVVTHNPWGEYGHEEHVQVFRAVLRAQETHGFRVWVSNYVSNKSLQFMASQSRMLEKVTPPLATDAELCRELMALYVDNRCWTWPQNYRWPDHEVFFSVPAGDPVVEPSTSLPLNLIEYDVQSYSMTRSLRGRLLHRFRRRA